MDAGIIKKLDDEVVNRIAAGEIIQRPANAVKEMLENSLDAKSTLIQITIKSGGLKFLQIHDDGTGIRKEDLEIVCERFTTSKLEKFEDLTTISTFGFRGEALASISHVAHLTIQTKTAQEKCAYKATYEDGKIKCPPKACAGNQGTIITIEDLFYNVPQRRQALKSPNDEYQKISDVISKYAVHNANVGFSLKKYGETTCFRTPVKSTQIENIKIIYGSCVTKELIHVKLIDDVHQFKMNGYITTPNYSTKKGLILLFINNRLVECAALKAAVDTIYNTYLPKGSFPFIYMSIEIEQTHVDVNVHPTKHEVHFLHEEEIIEKIKLNIESNLLGNNTSRIFYKQMRLSSCTEKQNTSTSDEHSLSSERVYAKDLVRTDSKIQKLEKFFGSPNKSKIKLDVSSETLHTTLNKTEEFSQKAKKITKLTSILNIQRRIENECSSQLKNILKTMTFVGVVNKSFALFQHETKLYLCNTLIFSYDFFYQSLIFNFENFKTISFDPPLSIRELALIALDSKESGWTEEDGCKTILAERIVEILKDKSDIMKEYFGLRINSNGYLETLPVLLENYAPSICFLPIYILRLATEVDWESEEECFKGFCNETANYYLSVPRIEEGTKKHKWCVEYLLYPAFKQKLIPSHELRTNLFEVAYLPNLYKVFERC